MRRVAGRMSRGVTTMMRMWRCHEYWHVPLILR